MQPTATCVRRCLATLAVTLASVFARTQNTRKTAGVQRISYFFAVPALFDKHCCSFIDRDGGQLRTAQLRPTTIAEIWPCVVSKNLAISICR